MAGQLSVGDSRSLQHDQFVTTRSEHTLTEPHRPHAPMCGSAARWSGRFSSAHCEYGFANPVNKPETSAPARRTGTMDRGIGRL